MVCVVQERQGGAELCTHGLEDPRDVPEVGAGVPVLFERQGGSRGRLVVILLPGNLVAADAVDPGQPRHAGLDTDGLEAIVQEVVDRCEERLDGSAGCVSVRERPTPAPAAEQLVHRQAGDLALDVPQRHVHGRDGRHRDRSAAPVRPAVQVLPGVFDVVRLAADQQRRDVVAQVGGDGELATVERGVAEPDYAVARRELQGDEVAPGAGDADVDLLDLHRATQVGTATWSWTCGTVRTPSPLRNSLTVSATMFRGYHPSVWLSHTGL